MKKKKKKKEEEEEEEKKRERKNKNTLTKETSVTLQVCSIQEPEPVKQTKKVRK